MQSLKVPCWPGLSPWLRGTISYHAPLRARGRSATNGNSCERVRSARNWLSAIASCSSSVSRGAVSPVCRKSSHCRRITAEAAAPPACALVSMPAPSMRIEGEVGAGFLLQFETMPPSGEFVGPGLDGIDVAAGLIRHERAAPAVVAVMDHRRAAPFPVLLAAPDHRTGDDVMAVAIDVGPDVDALAGDALHGKAAAVDQRKNIFDMESTAGCGALDSLSCFVHGDATDLLTILEPSSWKSRLQPGPVSLRKTDASDLYRKPIPGIGSRGNAGGRIGS